MVELQRLKDEQKLRDQQLIQEPIKLAQKQSEREEDLTKREEQLDKAVLQAKRAEEQSLRDVEMRKQAEAQKKAEAERARRDTAAQKKAEAEAQRVEAMRRREEEARRAEEGRRADEARRAAAATAAAPKPADPAAKPPAPDVLALAEQARARGNDAESLAILRKAADQGNAKAQFALGEMFAAGRGVPQSNFQSYVWFARASRAGHADAKARQEQVKATLQPAEIQHAEKLLR